MRKIVMAVMALTLSGCVETTGSAPKTQTPAKTVTDIALPAASKNRTMQNFLAVVHRMEPGIERECRVRTSGENCNFKIVIDGRKDQKPNAFQKQDKHGRPIIAFTQTMIASFRNEDEIALVLGHEAAHHLKGHIPKTRDSLIEGAVVGGLLAAAGGGNAAVVKKAQERGGHRSSRVYSKQYELEADELGTIIMIRAGYNALRGVAIMKRISDPGNRYLGSHPPNAERIAIIRRTAAKM